CAMALHATVCPSRAISLSEISTVVREYKASMRQYRPTSSEGPPIALLYQRYASSIFAYACKHASSVEDTEDILVEVFVAALESESFFALTGQQQGAWLWGVTRHKIADSYRRRHRHPQVPLDLFDEVDVEDEASAPEAMSLQHEQERQ